MIKQVPKSFYQTVKAIQFSYNELQDCSINLNDKIEQAYGSHGLGICIVSDIPNYVRMRLQLLPLAQKLASLPKQELKKLERPEAYHIKGWSCGVEKFKGIPDTSKGSFYNNPTYDDSYLTEEEWNSLGESRRLIIPNVWPAAIPELEYAFKNLGRLMIHTGGLLAQHIDKYIYSRNHNYEKQKLYRFIRSGDQHIARLLHYFPSTGDDEWCGWHNDHSALTALTCPIYMKNDQIVDFKDDQAGLLAKNRFADIVKVEMDPKCLAFQIGETAQIVSGGIVEATPHCVVRGEKAAKENINRNTFALFMAPRFNEKLSAPKGTPKDSCLNKSQYNIPELRERWIDGDSYINYSNKTMKAYS